MPGIIFKALELKPMYRGPQRASFSDPGLVSADRALCDPCAAVDTQHILSLEVRAENFRLPRHKGGVSSSRNPWDGEAQPLDYFHHPFCR